jgi:O-antigen/teichoic acid export membrane protein
MISNKKNYFFTLFAGVGGMASSAIMTLITVPVSLNYWKTERYGIWVLLTSALVYLGMTNLGLNSSASLLMAKNPKIRDKIKILKRSFVLLLCSVVLMFVVFLVINLLTRDWINIIGKIPENLTNETFQACVVLVIFYLLSLPFSLLATVYNGFQRLYIENIFNVLLNILNFVVLLLVIFLKGDLVIYAIVWGCTLVSFNIFKFLFFYFVVYKKIPLEEVNERGLDGEETQYRTIFVTGIRFFLIGIAAMVVWNSDIFVISNFISVKTVASYFVAFKLFSIFFQVIYLINGSIMPVLAKEYGNNNWEWINTIYSNLLVLIAIVGGACWIIGILFFRDFITLWAGAENYVGLLTVIVFGGYAYLLSMVNLNSGVIYAFNYSRHAPVVAWAEAIFKISVAILLVKYLGVMGVALGSLLGSLLAPTWVLPVWIRKRSGGKLYYDLHFLKNHLFMALIPGLLTGIACQVFISNIFIRLLTGAVILLAYLLVSYFMMPLSYKTFFHHHLNEVLKRVGIKALNVPAINSNPGS